jgi:ribonuclease BN (tRNA processing enzyme)
MVGVGPQMPRITFVGTGEAFDPGLPNTSLLYRGESTLLCDCGFRVPHAFWNLTGDPSLLDAIYITHQHADHSFGLPALLLWMREEGRTRPLEVVGGPGVGAWLEKLLELGYPGSYAPDRCYPIEPRELRPGEQLERGALWLSNSKSGHGVRNLSLRIDESPHSFAYSGDGAPSDATRALYRGVGLLVHECYAADDAPRGHASARELLAMADELGVGTLCLLHIGRREKDAVRAEVARYRGATRVVLPAPGDSIELQ